ncbi:unnamed protein product [Macrosiphum euphorbiae]|uniref:Uncharacterized protein n=1 Tax=Macrosiphum euphorbiae TaxID=13131 RepID=A0AAV0XTU8_9HEMI|nr:unnamed protein product [Macrosiphum euphorbiae]
MLKTRPTADATDESPVVYRRAGSVGTRYSLLSRSSYLLAAWFLYALYTTHLAFMCIIFCFSRLVQSCSILSDPHVSRSSNELNLRDLVVDEVVTLAEINGIPSPYHVFWSGSSSRP